MNFGFDEDQQALRAAAEKLLAAHAGVARAGLDDAGAWKPLWTSIVELGWTSLAVPEALGGLGLGAVDLVALAEVTGRWVLPAPFLSSAGLAGPVLAATGAHPESLAAIAEGRVTTLAVGDVTWDGDVLRGRAPLVPDAARAETLVVVAGPVVAVVAADADGVAIHATHAADPNRPLADVHLDGVRPLGAVEADAEPGLDAARTVLAAELVGVADRILELSVEHARSRAQFGQPIGAFQAVKHRLADLYVAVERARTLTYAAAMALDDPGTTVGRRVEAASLAKAAASETALAAFRTGVQVHGAIAITWEHDLHLFGRRARQGALALGDHLVHYQRAAESFLDDAFLGEAG
ncbi:MAG: acyl-CoA dehydrogenase [Actinomycetia bacterium]|nr:acyl-CoA dehydrogenase [Actinomycetes bacterium]